MFFVDMIVYRFQDYFINKKLAKSRSGCQDSFRCRDKLSLIYKNTKTMYLQVQRCRMRGLSTTKKLEK
ncbi:hypothetical protein MERGE_001919 [Pneumocystis wakefieldiae]|uniref:Uncharacterized protein n=1 Tax=Pneumocystis wakefieldiae TaxID=38082 RepID=A0A899FZS5_9ASCO|nr:hypothetical protein MERGE_001919 [Pneumocystis wakefieldiae]